MVCIAKLIWTVCDHLPDKGWGKVRTDLAEERSDKLCWAGAYHLPEALVAQESQRVL